MAPMRKPASSTRERSLSIDAYARRHGLTPREVRKLLGTGQLPFMEVRGQIRVRVASVQSFDESPLHGNQS